MAIDLKSRLLSTSAAGEYLSTSRWTILRLIHSGELPAIRRFKYLRVDRADLDTFINNSKS